MSLWLEEKFLKQISHRLEGFKAKSNHVYNFKCALCGDSSKNKNKMRGYVVAKGGKLFYYCHNCNASLLFTTFLKEFDVNLYNQYVLENFKEKQTTIITECVTNSHIPETRKYIPDIFSDLPLVRELDVDSHARVLCDERKLPYSTFNFYYAENFIKWTSGNTDKFDKWRGSDHPRLIIPWHDRDGKIIGYSARAMDSTQEQKYYRIFVDNEVKERVFGLDRLDESKPKYVLEGELDSLMLPNAVAVSNGKLHTYINKDAIYIPDADRRNPHICRNINEMIALGLKVCLLPDNLPGKDLNELVMKNFTTEQLLGIINDNTFSGILAKLKFDRWKMI